MVATVVPLYINCHSPDSGGFTLSVAPLSALSNGKSPSPGAKRDPSRRVMAAKMRLLVPRYDFPLLPGALDSALDDNLWVQDLGSRSRIRLHAERRSARPATGQIAAGRLLLNAPTIRVKR